LQTAEKAKKGPADYKTETKQKIPGSYTYKSEKEAFYSEVKYLSLERPAPA
jgi:hypothetical protein